MSPAAAASASTPPPVFSTSRRLGSTGSSLDIRYGEVRILPRLRSKCDGNHGQLFPAASCVRVAHDLADPDGAARRFCMPSHLPASPPLPLLLLHLSPVLSPPFLPLSHTP